MRACGGTWIAHGSGSADKEMVDADDRIAVPPADPAYMLRRVWLGEEEQEGYYYGFANEGLWPLCHIAFIRPIFRESDWRHYVAVNERFADAVVKEATQDDPIVLVQDYHFALLPRMVRQRLPKATIVTFWHIPWPNSETFSICPWREETACSAAPFSASTPSSTATTSSRRQTASWRAASIGSAPRSP
jgi:trehalose 6-phosphate synthase